MSNSTLTTATGPVDKTVEKRVSFEDLTIQKALETVLSGCRGRNEDVEESKDSDTVSDSVTNLFEWTGIDEMLLPVRTGRNHLGTRGLLVTRALHAGDTILVLPWKFVLGPAAAYRLLCSEDDRGRGVLPFHCDSLPQVLRLILGKDDDAIQDDDVTENKFIWSCIMACAILSAVRYPLSSWSPFVSCLPAGPGRIQTALQLCHAHSVKQSIKRKEKEAIKKLGGVRLTQGALKKAMDAYRATMLAEREIMSGLLMWPAVCVNSLCDDSLKEMVQFDSEWLRRVWDGLFLGCPWQEDATHEESSHSKTEKEPLVSWESWLWAHSIIRSRAVGMPQAPQNILAFPTFNTARCSEHRVLNADDKPQKSNFFGDGVLLPIIDLINHGGASNANAGLNLRTDGVAVVANENIEMGAEVLFDYHPNSTLRQIIRGYGFVDTFSKPLRQIFFAGRSRVKIDVTVTSGVVHDDEQTATMCCGRPLMRLVGMYVAGRGGGMTVVIHDDSHESDFDKIPEGIEGRTNRFLDEGSLYDSAVACCRVALAEIQEQKRVSEEFLDDTSIGCEPSWKEIARHYQAANAELLTRCVEDLSSVSDLLTF